MISKFREDPQAPEKQANLLAMGKKRVHPAGSGRRSDSSRSEGNPGQSEGVLRNASGDVPTGMPIQALVKVSDQHAVGARKTAAAHGQTDVRFSKNKVSVEGQEYDFDFVFGPEAGEKQIIERSLKPLVKALADGVSASLIVLGSYGSEKNAMVEKFLPTMVQDLFANLHRAQGGKHQASNFQVKVKAFEICDEVIQDMFNAENRDLSIIHDPLEGYVVSQCSMRGPYRNVEDVIDVLVDSFNSRTSGMTDFGPASRHTSTMWQIDVEQNHHQRHLRSRLILAEVAGTDKLAEDRSVIRAREGPSLGKSVLTLQSVAESLERGEQDYALFSESKLTQLLEDSLAGNCITLVLALAKQGEGEATAATLQLAEMLREGSTYPAINDERVQGLLRRYRLQINRLRDEISIRAGRGGGTISRNGSVEDAQELTVKLHELEGRVVRDNLEKLRMKEEKEKIYGKLVEFREKYNKLVEQKSSIQAASIKGEEEKLKISKALLDLRIENNKLVERAEAEKYELVTKLLNAENEVLQYEMRQESHEKTMTTLKQDLQEANQSSEGFKSDLIQLKDSYTRLETQFKEELTKNEELGVELLTLVNQKNALLREAEELRRERAALEEEKGQGDAKWSKLTSERATLEDDLANERQISEELRAEKLKIQLELQRKQVEFETQKLDLERNAADYNRERDSEVSQLKTRLEAEMKRNETQREHLDAEARELRSSFKSSTRRIKDLETQLSEKTEELSLLRAENTRLDEKINTITEDYRNKLLDQLNVGSTLDDHSSLATSSILEAADKEREGLQSELVQTFKNRESELEKRVRTLQQTNQRIVEKNRTLFSRYSALRFKLQDMEVDTDKVELLQTSAASEDSDLKVESSQIEEQLRHEIVQIKQRLEKAGSDLQAAQEKNITLAASIKRIHREQEVRVADLQAEIKMLERQKANLEEENHNISQRNGGSGHGGNDAETAKRMQEIQDKLLEKIEELQSASANQNRSRNQASSPDLEKENRDLQDQVDRYKRELDKTRRMSSPFPPGADEEELRRLREENEKLRKLYSQQATSRGVRPTSPRLDSRVSPGMIDSSAASPKLSGRQYADLLTRATVAEEELENYKTYLKESLARSQREIKKLKEERDMWKQRAGG